MSFSALRKQFVHCIPEHAHCRESPTPELDRPLVALFGCDSEGMFTGVFAATNLPPFTGTISICSVSGLWCSLCSSCIPLTGALSLREPTSPNAALKELRFLGLATSNLRPRFLILLQILRPTTESIFIARQGSDARSKQWEVA